MGTYFEKNRWQSLTIKLKKSASLYYSLLKLWPWKSKNLESLKPMCATECSRLISGLQWSGLAVLLSISLLLMLPIAKGFRSNSERCQIPNKAVSWNIIYMQYLKIRSINFLTCIAAGCLNHWIYFNNSLISYEVSLTGNTFSQYWIPFEW